ncbi:MAG: hypothetical protein WCR02_07640, partial [Sphaerochaetaceae bacterium]
VCLQDDKTCRRSLRETGHQAGRRGTHTLIYRFQNPKIYKLELNNAIAAKYYKIPYYVFALSPDFSKKGMADLVMEQRDGSEITHCLGQWTTEEGIDAKYPAFDCIPCSLVSRVVTPRGVFKPEKVEERDS